jgi:hypothetical protein
VSEGSANSSGNACANACRAFASMKRAVDTLCQLSGDADDRCVDARKTLQETAQRVAQCGC